MWALPFHQIPDFFTPPPCSYSNLSYLQFSSVPPGAFQGTSAISAGVSSAVCACAQERQGQRLHTRYVCVWAFCYTAAVTCRIVYICSIHIIISVFLYVLIDFYEYCSSH